MQEINELTEDDNANIKSLTEEEASGVTWFWIDFVIFLLLSYINDEN